MGKVTQLANAVNTRQDFMEFLDALCEELPLAPDHWSNTTLEEYLEAARAWTSSFDGYFLNRGESVPSEPSWRLFAMILAAARMYE